MKAPGGGFTWTRAVSLTRLAEDLPVVGVQDSYTGEEAAAAKVLTLDLTADRPVETPAAEVTPPERIWGCQSLFGDRMRLASAGHVVTLEPGVSRRGFTGQAWKARRAEGVEPLPARPVGDHDLQRQCRVDGLAVGRRQACGELKAAAATAAGHLAAAVETRSIGG